MLEAGGQLQGRWKAMPKENYERAMSLPGCHFSDLGPVRLLSRKLLDSIAGTATADASAVQGSQRGTAAGEESEIEMRRHGGSGGE